MYTVIQDLECCTYKWSGPELMFGVIVLYLTFQILSVCINGIAFIVLVVYSVIAKEQIQHT